VHALAGTLAAGLKALGIAIQSEPFFDTLRVELGAARAAEVLGAARSRHINLRKLAGGAVGVALDETTTAHDVAELLEVFGGEDGPALDLDVLAKKGDSPIPAPHARKTPFLEHPVFHENRSEHEMLRYLRRLESRDLSLTTSMIPLGSCTMKLNATSEMLPVTWPEWGNLHPFAPREETQGYLELFRRLESALCEITGFAATSLQPNAGSQGEYAGLLVIRAYHHSRGDTGRTVCLIPSSAHGTNPASAVMAGMEVVKSA
jgi:glycine dehydrogenase